MIEFGKTLREAREQKGYTVSQLAEMTHILPSIIENLEREDFSKIVAPIYGRGFVKLYCEAVGLESRPLVDEFMSIYTGARPPVIRMKEEGGATAEQHDIERVEVVEAVDEPVPEPEAVDEPPPPVVPLFERTIVRQKEWAQTTSAQQQDDSESVTTDEPAEPEMYAKKRDYRLPGYSVTEVPKRYWRFGVLLAAAIAIVALLAVGTRALYRATMVPSQGDAGEVERQERHQTYGSKEGQQAYDNEKEGNTNRATRKGVKTPPLYID